MPEQQPPDPLVRPDVDLTDFPYMPLDVRRLRDSGLASKVSGDAFRAAVLLWCASWHQVPAASLPDDDEELASLAGYGFGSGVRDWRKIRAGALRGWVKCSDGRLYHGVVAEKANEAWTSKLQHRHRRECERLKKMGQRLDVRPTYPSFEEWIEHRDRTGSDRWPDPKRPEGHPSNVPGDMPPESRGTDPARPEDVPGPVPGDSVSKGEGEGKGKGKGKEKKEENPPNPPPAAAASAVPLPDWLDLDSWAAWKRHRRAMRKPMTVDAERLAVRSLERLRTEGYPPRQVIENAIERGWQALYAPKDGAGVGPPRTGRETTEEHNRRAFAEWMGEPTDDGRTIDA